MLVTLLQLYSEPTELKNSFLESRAVVSKYSELKVYLTQDRAWKERFHQNMFDVVALVMMVLRKGHYLRFLPLKLGVVLVFFGPFLSDSPEYIIYNLLFLFSPIQPKN